MFRDKRQFRAIVFHAPKITDFESLLSLLPEGVVDSVEVLNGSSVDFGIAHALYWSESLFTDPETLAGSASVRGTREVYPYNMYLGRLRRFRKTYFVIAVPFSKMAVEVFGALDKGTGAQGRMYQMPDLIRLAAFLKSKQDEARQFCATAVRFAVTGDSDVDSCSINGSNVLLSRTLLRATEGLRGITLIPKRVRVAHESDLGRFTCECDSFGNYWFRVSASGGNLFRMEPFLESLLTNKLLRQDAAFPLRRSVQEIEEALTNA